MEEFEGRVMRELEVLKSVNAQLEGLATISARLDALDSKFGEQVERIDSVQAKVHLTMTSLGEVRQEQVEAARASKQPHASAEGDGDGIIHPKPPPPFSSTLTPPFASPRYTSDQTQQQFDPGKRTDEGSNRKHWMPKMDFPKFDGTDARIWVDGCESYFSLYDIPANFKVVSATLHMVGDAAHWFHAYKLAHEWPNWGKFREAVLAEFDRNVYRDRMKELMVLKQRGTVEEYRREFNQLVYQLRLYEPAVSETMLVTRFVMGLKEELKPAVEIQLPNTVSEAAAYAKAKVKHYADKNRSARSFEVGDTVFLKLQPYAQTSVVNRPFFHVSQLKELVPDYTPVFSTLPATVDLSQADMIPQKILDRRLVKQGNQSHVQVLVQWSSQPVSAATWEDHDVLKMQFPDAPAWGHAGSQGGGNVSTVMPGTDGDHGVKTVVAIGGSG
ncbi:hypothetical protein QYE76_068263 [Lolium multiflorum]|uniref:Retrotransposon gag domain-containing protein n=1 Tax=Lolium multiflorum TaxID=4521 RepID=A0AAD8SFZ5_LOLMU|nr:hypothetical protein QYE76_068263 [Lolium multiflorum]